jgi:hypothetical protein
MLSRWGEYVNTKRDTYNSFPADESIAYKYNFLDRAVVNEYAQILWRMLPRLGINQQCRPQHQQFFLTHDVDTLYFWSGPKQLLRLMAGDLLRRRNIKLALERAAEYYLVVRKKIKDPYDTFEWLMDKSEAIGVKSRFYFMSGGVTDYDNQYSINDPIALELIEKIKQRGHIIGIHPSYNAYNDFNQLKEEKKRLEEIVKQPITEGREHYLRFEVPTTWQIWEDNGLELDSTCGYAEKEGFRCGTGEAFSVFNILSRKQLRLKERPLIVMEDSFATAQPHITPEQMLEKVKTLIERTGRGTFTLLWHNSNFATQKWEKYRGLYEKIIKL